MGHWGVKQQAQMCDFRVEMLKSMTGFGGLQSKRCLGLAQASSLVICSSTIH